jgi:nucleoside-diphosphate-sugar epimerase
MKIGVTGATGFIGQNLIPILLSRGHHVVALSRDQAKAEAFAWYSEVDYVSDDIHEPDAETIRRFAQCDSVIHLAWPGLPNYGELFHIEVNYPAAYLFLKRLIETGLKKLTVAGTCFEYGLKNGCLSEDAPAEPANSYGLAKVFLLRSLEELQKKTAFRLKWLRLFYQFGPGQPGNSLMGQLDKAIAEKASHFKMSRGEQLRDYMHVSKTAELILQLEETNPTATVINVCSGTPISVRSLIESRLRSEKTEIALQLGYYDYSPHEALAFWGNRSRLEEAIAKQ